jgi:hypothetical protein
MSTGLQLAACLVALGVVGFAVLVGASPPWALVAPVGALALVLTRRPRSDRAEIKPEPSTTKRRGRAEAKRERSAIDRRALDVRRGFLLAHVALEIVLVVGAMLGWYSLFLGDRVFASVAPGAHVSVPGGLFPFVEQARLVILAAVVAFFFTSYDLVADADIQWPPLLASAFALGCCGQVCWKLDKSFDAMVDYVVAAETLAHRKSATPGEAKPVSPPGGSQAPVTSGSIAAPGSASTSQAPAPVRLKIDTGLKLVLFASASMTLLSTYLTFFARRA